MKKANVLNKKYAVMCMVFVVSLAVIAISVSYAILFIPVQGDPTESSLVTGDYGFTSNLNETTAINAKNLGLINEDEIDSLAPSTSFTVRARNNREDIKYNVYLKDITISNNLIDSIGSFKWQLLKDGTVIEQGDFRNLDTVGIKKASNVDTATTKSYDSYDLKDGLAFDGLNTTTLTFRVYILNDDIVDQTAMVNGTFQAKIGVVSYIASYKCTRAKTLHTAGSSYFGNKGTLKTMPEAGDAFDCDVNGDGKFDSTNERYYFVSNTWRNGSFNQNSATLIAANNRTVSSWSDSVSSGPTTILNNLPTIVQWKNVELTGTTRNIYQGSSLASASTVAATGFDYDGRAARLLTAQELLEACPDAESSLDSCTWLMENTYYQNSSMPTGYWLETAADNTSIWTVNGSSENVSYASSDNSTDYGIRPVIEVPYTKIDY